MPVLKQLRVDDVTYDTVGEASVTQVVGTGTKIATVTIDGTATDLYAPSGGSSEAMTDAEIEAAVEAAEVSHTITLSGESSTYAAHFVGKNNEIITSATYGEVVTVCTLNDITSITSSPTVTFESIPLYSNRKRFVMPNENITITLTVQSGGGGND